MKPGILPAVFEVSGSLSSGRAQLIPRHLANCRQPPTSCKFAQRTSLMSVVQAQESRAIHNQIQTSWSFVGEHYQFLRCCHESFSPGFLIALSKMLSF